MINRNKEIKLSVLEVNMIIFLKNPNWKIIRTKDKGIQKVAKYKTNIQKQERDNCPIKQ